MVQTIIWNTLVLKDMSPQTIKNCWNKVQILLVVSMANITSQNEWEKSKKVPKIEELNMLIVATRFKWIHYQLKISSTC